MTVTESKAHRTYTPEIDKYLCGPRSVLPLRSMPELIGLALALLDVVGEDVTAVAKTLGHRFDQEHWAVLCSGCGTTEAEAGAFDWIGPLDEHFVCGVCCTQHHIRESCEHCHGRGEVQPTSDPRTAEHCTHCEDPRDWHAVPR